MTMIGKYKWLLVPPAAAVILFLGPLRNGAGAPTPKDAATKAVQETITSARTRPVFSAPCSIAGRITSRK